MTTGISVHIRPAQYLETYGVAQVLTCCFYDWGSWLTPLWEFLVASDVQGRMLENEKYYACLIAIVAPMHIIGSVEVSLKRLPLGKVPYLYNLAVHPQWRRQGIAQKLLGAAEQQILRWHFGELYLHVLAGNAPAQNLYHRSGYFCLQRENRLFRGDRLLYRKQL